MSSIEARPQQNHRLIFGFSFGVHLVVLIVALLLGGSSKSSVDANRTVVKTKLVKLGKKRDEKLLPRKVQNRPPSIKKKKEPKKKDPKKETPKPPTAKKINPIPQPVAPSTKDVLEKFKETERPDLSELIDDKLGDIDDEGDPEGSKIGREISGRIRATYNDRILGAVKGDLTVPSTINEKERLFLKAVLYLAIDGNGGIISTQISTKSGNPAFDNAVLAAAKKAAPYPTPPLQERDFYRAGVRMNVCPISCQ